MSILKNFLPDAPTVATYVNEQILMMAYAGAFQIVSATRDANHAIVTADIQWADGTPGVLTTDVASTAWPGAIDAYHVTYVVGNTTKTITQPQITRGTIGTITSQPALTIS